MTTTTSSTSSTTSSAASSILTALNAGSGIDTSSLVTNLVSAEFADRTDALTTKQTAVTKQISDVGTLLSDINNFSSSLTSLVKGGTLTTQPTSSNSSVLGVTALSGASAANVSASVEVRQLAQAEAAATGIVADAGAAIGTGSFTLTFGTATVANGQMTGFTAGAGTPVGIAIDSSHSSLTGIAAAINGANAGVTASIISDGDGARLMLKGATGASQAFTLTASDGSDAALSNLNIGVGTTGTTIGTPAQDAIVALDGVAVKRSSNTINNLIAGVKLNLVTASPGTTVTIGSTPPTSAISQAVSDFVDTYNQIQAVIAADIDPASGSLAQDSAAKTLMRSLSQITLTKLTGGTGTVPTTLAEIGVETNRDGTLSVDSTKLASALTTYPDALEAMFADGTGASGGGLSAALGAIATAAQDTTFGLTASQTTYTARQSTLTDQQTALATQQSNETTRMTAQFSAMNARVSSYKSIQSFLTEQIDVWTKSTSS